MSTVIDLTSEESAALSAVLDQAQKILEADERPAGSFTAKEYWQHQEKKGGGKSEESYRNQLEKATKRGEFEKTRIGRNVYYSFAASTK